MGARDWSALEGARHGLRQGLAAYFERAAFQIGGSIDDQRI
jgi:hypothetical protein